MYLMSASLKCSLSAPRMNMPMSARMGLPEASVPWWWLLAGSSSRSCGGGRLWCGVAV
jgi:hypothetical protein